MVPAHFGEIARRLRGALAGRDAAGLSDADLVARYVRRRDEAAFAALVRRHGPMVLGVCRRILRHPQDAEDAFQATFLVLVRRAASLRSPETIANWLHGVACRTALEARGAAARRRAREAAVPPRSEPPDDPWAELRHVLDQELGRLGERYRAVVVLCDLEGKTRKEAARQLGWAEGTVASRLARGRDLLARRLARRGFAGSLAAAAVAQSAASAGVPAGLVNATVAAGAAGTVPVAPRVAALTAGVLSAMFRTKVRSAVAASVILGLTALGTGASVSDTRATDGGSAGQKAAPDDRHDRIAELKQQIQEMQRKLTDLEREAKPTPKDRIAIGTALADRFAHRVPFEYGFTEARDGGRIDIREVWGTRPKIEVGGQYLVRGKYTLPKGRKGKLYFYATANGAWNEVATLDLQMVELDKPEGEFTLVHGMAGEGNFHLILTDPEKYSDWFANVYFGTGDNVFRPKQ
jgi:RNA polymerase sigma factor (sigma-70 family)